MKVNVNIAEKAQIESVFDLCLNASWYSSSWFEKCIILRWFDSDTVAQFIRINKQENPLDFLLNIPFIETRNHGYAIHDVIRELKYHEIYSKSPAQIQKLHKEAAAYYWDRLHSTSGLFAQSIIVEYFYHLFHVDHKRGISELQKIMSKSRLLQPELFNVLLSITNEI